MTPFNGIPPNLQPDPLGGRLGNGDKYHISLGQRYKCPKCGNEPVNVQPGLPEGTRTRIEGETEEQVRVHCHVCFQRYQAEKAVAEIREHIPELVKIEDYVEPDKPA